MVLQGAYIYKEKVSEEEESEEIAGYLRPPAGLRCGSRDGEGRGGGEWICEVQETPS